MQFVYSRNVSWSMRTHLSGGKAARVRVRARMLEMEWLDRGSGCRESAKRKFSNIFAGALTRFETGSPGSLISREEITRSALSGAVGAVESTEVRHARCYGKRYCTTAGGRSDSVAVGEGPIFPSLIGISNGAAPGVEETDGSSHGSSQRTVEQT